MDDDSGTHVSVMNGIGFRLYSFSTDQYRQALADHGLTLIDVHEDKGENGYYLATKGN